MKRSLPVYKSGVRTTVRDKGKRTFGKTTEEAVVVLRLFRWRECRVSTQGLVLDTITTLDLKREQNSASSDLRCTRGPPAWH